MGLVDVGNGKKTGIQIETGGVGEVAGVLVAASAGGVEVESAADSHQTTVTMRRMADRIKLAMAMVKVVSPVSGSAEPSSGLGSGPSTTSI